MILRDWLALAAMAAALDAPAASFFNDPAPAQKPAQPAASRPAPVAPVTTAAPTPAPPPNDMAQPADMQREVRGEVRALAAALRNATPPAAGAVWPAESTRDWALQNVEAALTRGNDGELAALRETLETTKKTLESHGYTVAESPAAAPTPAAHVNSKPEERRPGPGDPNWNPPSNRFELMRALNRR